MVTANAECSYTPVRCQWNKCLLFGDEIRFPLYRDGMVICEECDDHWDDEDVSECCMCGEEFQDDNWPGIFIAFSHRESGVRRGLYRSLKGWAFYTQALIGSGWVHDYSVQRIGPVPAGASGDGYPCGLVCRQCAVRTLRVVPQVQPGMRLDVAA